MLKIVVLLTAALAGAWPVQNIAARDNKLSFKHETQVLPITSAELYENAYDPAENAVYVANSFYSSYTFLSRIVKVDADSLKILEDIGTPREPNENLFNLDLPRGAFGLATDSKRGYLWTSDSGASSASIYSTKDLGHLYQFPHNIVNHSHEVRVDEETGYGYVGTGSLYSFIKVLELGNDTPVATIELGKERDFSTVDGIDIYEGKLYAVSYNGNVAARVDLRNNYAIKYIDLPGGKRTSGIAYDFKRDYVYVVSQISNNLIAIDVETSKQVFEKDLGAASWQVRYEPVHDLIYTISSAYIKVFNAATHEEVATLHGGFNNNGISVGDKGSVFVTDSTLILNKFTPQ